MRPPVGRASLSADHACSLGRFSRQTLCVAQGAPCPLSWWTLRSRPPWEGNRPLLKEGKPRDKVHLPFLHCCGLEPHGSPGPRERQGESRGSLTAAPNPGSVVGSNRHLCSAPGSGRPPLLLPAQVRPPPPRQLDPLRGSWALGRPGAEPGGGGRRCNILSQAHSGK